MNREEAKRLFSSLLPTGVGFSNLGGTVWNNLINTIADVLVAIVEEVDKVKLATMTNIADKTADELDVIEKRLWILRKGVDVDISERQSGIDRKLSFSNILGRSTLEYLQYTLNEGGFPNATVIPNLYWNTDVSRWVGVNPYFTDVDIYFGEDEVYLGDDDAYFGRYGTSGVTEVVANTILPDEGDNEITVPLTGNELRYTFIVTGVGGVLTELDRLEVPKEKERYFRELIMQCKPANTLCFLNVSYV